MLKKMNLKQKLISWILVVCITVSVFPETFYVWASELGMKDYESMTMQELLDCNENLTWVFAGDSITHNGSWAQGMNGHAEWFEQYLNEIDRDKDVVVNTAWGNADVYDFQYYENTPNGHGAKANPGMGLENMITSYNPDVVFIKIGMNNRSMSNATFIQYYNLMLDSILAEGEKNNKVPKIILLSPTPVSGENPYDLQVIPDRNEARGDNLVRFSDMIGTIANERGMAFCDLHGAFMDEYLKLGADYRQTLFSDPSDSTIHPNAAGQYLIFKSVCKTLGIYDETMPIFQYTYDDINRASLYTDLTSNVVYDNDYDTNQGADASEMNGTMPQLTTLLASIDFTSSNGVFSGSKIDLTNASIMTDPLTLKEVQSIENQFSIVFRAKLNAGTQMNQALFFMSSNGDANRKNSMCIGVPSKDDNMYYVVKNNNTNQTISTSLNNSTTFAVDSKKTNVDGEWHTIAIVQDISSYTYYVDGVAMYTCDYKLKDGYAIGDGYKGISADKFVAQIGAYSTDLNSNWWLNGKMDYFQFYKGAITAEQVKALSVNTPEQMNKQMPTLSQKTIAAVDLNSETGHFKGVKYNNTTKIDMTDASIMSDPLTLSEAKNMKKEYSVVFRAKLNEGATAFQPALFVSGGGSAVLNESVRIGVSGTNDSFYYEINSGGSEITTSANTFSIDSNRTIVNGEWHTVAIVQEATRFVYYIDGVAVATKDYYLKDGYNIGDVFASATASNFVAYIGVFHSELATYSLKGDMDYYQLYDVALTAAQVQSLSTVASGTDAEEMNGTMPKLDTTLVASIDFDSTNGTFNGEEYGSATKVDLTNANVMDDAFTLEEAQNLEDNFTIVFRAKLDAGSTINQAVLFASSTGTANRQNSFCVGVPSSSGGTYYTVASGNSRKTTSSSTTFTVDADKKTVDGDWHTIAIVQNDTQYLYYVDGALISATDCKLNNFKIGTVFKSATESTFTAQLGVYSEESAVKAFSLKGKMDYYQIYNTALTTNQISKLTVVSEQKQNTVKWSDTKAETFVWAVAGAEQMDGYETLSVNRSLFRYLDNVMRGGSDTVESMRDVRLLNFASKGNSVKRMLESYDSEIAKHDFDVFMILPEVSAVYDSNYVHSQELVDEYEADLRALIAKNKDVITAVWTPLASNNETINAYIDDYAAVVREISKDTANILFFDANRFMNENMQANVALARNWFENDMYISSLCALDVTRAFYTTIGTTGTGNAELTRHNLRYTSDVRTFKGPYVRDYVAPEVTVAGTKITVDTTAIEAAYPNMENLRVAILPFVNAGDYHKDIFYVDGFAFEAPYSNPVITVYGEQDGKIYRFKDVPVNVSTDATLDKTVNLTDVYLDDLQVVGAPTIEFNKNQLAYQVSLYQYQSQIQILAKAQKGLIITVDGKTVESGVNSGLISVESGDEILVTVRGEIDGVAKERTYTIQVERPEYADIIVTEIMMDGYDNCYDLIEIYNASGKTLDLKDYSIGYKSDYVNTDKDFINYYFTGNNEAFQSRMNESPSYTGINAITKYSSVWNKSEPESIPFQADSTMVIWVKYAKTGDNSKGANDTYDTLIDTLSNSEYAKVVPSKEQLVVAEVPVQEKLPVRSEVHLSTASAASKYFYLENDQEGISIKARDWFFVLKNTATQAQNGAITEAGNDIISAAMQKRMTAMENLSTVFAYNTTRGMSLLESSNETNNKTTFGAIEYWQKPWDSTDKVKPTAVNKTVSGCAAGTKTTITVEAQDDKELRAVELYIRDNGDKAYQKISEDYVLQSGIEGNGTITITNSETFTYSIKIENTKEYYVVVVDGNNNQTLIGSADEPCIISAMTVEKVSDISKYRGDVFEAPEVSSGSSEWIFAGWYYEEACIHPIGTDVTSGEAYAKFVDADLLSVKCQVTNGTVNDSSSAYNGKYVIRFVSSVDNLDYRNVGFQVTDKTGATKSAKSNTVYERIASNVGKVGDSQEEDSYVFSPMVVNMKSRYFVTAKMAVAEGNVDDNYVVSAFWTTMDGTKVYGKARKVAVEDGLVTDSLNLSFHADAEATKGDELNVTYGNNKSAKAEVIYTDGAYVTVRIKGIDVKTLSSATKFDFGSYGSTIYRNLYTKYTGTGTDDTSWYDVYMKENSHQDEFLIATNADLYGFMNLLADRTLFKDKTVYLVGDIAMNENVTDDVVEAWADGSKAAPYKWVSSGTDDVSTQFTGTFDGQMHTISGIYMNVNKQRSGFFGCTAKESTVKNFYLTDSFFTSSYSSSTALHLGSVVGECWGTLENVYSDAIVVAERQRVGGLVGVLNTVTAAEAVGIQATVNNCWFDGEVRISSDNGRYAGGVVGFVMQKEVQIKNCLFTGKLSYTFDNGGVHMGGILGGNTNNPNIHIEDCVSAGEITGTYFICAGTIFGYLAGSSSRIEVVNAYGVAESLVGASGQLNGSKASGATIVGPGTSYSEEQLQGVNAYDNTLLDFDNTWVARTGKVPTLKVFDEMYTTEEAITDFGNTVRDGWYNANNTRYGIHTDDGLFGLSEISKKQNFSGKTIYLSNDIDLNPGWVAPTEANATITGNPVVFNTLFDQANGGQALTGTFDGRNHTVSGLYIHKTLSGTAMFGRMNAGGTIKNLAIKNAYIRQDYAKGAWTGSLLGLNFGGTVEGIYSNATICTNAKTAQAGGLIGRAEGTHKNLWFDGKLFLTYPDPVAVEGGGIAGRSWGRTGTTQPLRKTSFENCLNTGTITYNPTSTSNTDAALGGILGRDSGYSEFTFTNCVNLGRIDTNMTNGVSGFIGILAGVQTDYTKATITDCYYTSDSIVNKGSSELIATKHAKPELIVIANCGSVSRETLESSDVYNDSNVTLDFAQWTVRTNGGLIPTYFVNWIVPASETVK